eukprot:16623_1
MALRCFDCKLELCVWALYILIALVTLVSSFIKPDSNVFLSFISFFVLKTGDPALFFYLALFYGISLMSDIVWLSTSQSIQHWTYADQAHAFAISCSACAFVLKITFAITLLIISRYWNQFSKSYFQ